MESENNVKELFGEVIYAHTREQAIADGVLIDVSKTAKEAGIRFPVALTSAVWHEYIVPNEELKGYGQSEGGRLLDVLWMFRCSARKNASDVMFFELYFLMNENGKPEQNLVTLKAMCGPGDNGEPVITIMKPDED
jgi:hypothetical protein